MTNYRFIVLSNAVEGQEEAYASWYDGAHIADILEVDGFKAAQRFRRVASPTSVDLPADAPHEFLAIYDVETDDPEATLAQLSVQARKSTSEAIDMGRTVAWWFEEITERRTS